jgi:hypothetical protein
MARFPEGETGADVGLIRLTGFKQISFLFVNPLRSAMVQSMSQETDIRHLATKADLHQELHALTWRFLTLLVAQTGLILGAMYFMLTHLKS